MLIALATPAEAGPFTKNFGDTSTTCPSQWFTSTCEANQVVFGGANRLAMTVDDHDVNNYGVLIRGSGTIAPNGISFLREFEADGETYLKWEIEGYVLAGAGAAVGRIVYFDANLDEVGTVLLSTSVSADKRMVLYYEGAPAPTTEFIRLDVGVIGTNTYVWVDRVDFQEVPFGGDTGCNQPVKTQAECNAIADQKRQSFITNKCPSGDLSGNVTSEPNNCSWGGCYTVSTLGCLSAPTQTTTLPVGF